MVRKGMGRKGQEKRNGRTDKGRIVTENRHGA